MTSLQDFFSQPEPDSARVGIVQKNYLLKRDIIAYLAQVDSMTLADLARELNVSIPTVTKLVEELIQSDIVVDLGKLETNGGRRPNIFGLADSAVYFAGIEVTRDQIVSVITDLKNNVISTRHDNDFQLEDTPECLETICTKAEEILASCGISPHKLLGVGVAIAGRVNPNTGRSYKYFTDNDQSLSSILSERLGHPVLIENDTRAKCYGEYVQGDNSEVRNTLYLNLGRGVAIGIIIDGKLYYGHSGFAGEFGHTPFFDNDILCDCGKRGCLETEVSGIAIERKMAAHLEAGRNSSLAESYKHDRTVHIKEIIAAACQDDTLAIELIEEAGEKVGRSLAFLINIFNPEQVIIGGIMAQAGDYLMLPLKSAVNKHSLRLVSKDTLFRTTRLEDNIGALGAAMLIRNRIIGL